MFGIGMPEMLIILAVALIVFGPKKLPELAKSLGKALGEFRKATAEFKSSLDVEADLRDLTQVKRTFDEMNQPSANAAAQESVKPEDQADAPAPAAPSRPIAEDPDHAARG